MSQILFIGNYPNLNIVKDGMMQRIKHIDDIFINYKRHYLCISFKKYITPNEYEEENLVSYEFLNFFLHHRKIRKVICSYKYIYVHSIYNYLKIARFIKKSNIVILDLHGVVPEEILYEKRYIKSIFYNRVEQEAFKRANYQIFVTRAMAKHFEDKYGKINGILYPILPSNLVTYAHNEMDNRFKKTLGINDDEIVFIYSGNTSSYQNIDLMIKTIKNLKNEKYKFIILSNEMEFIKNKLIEYKVNSNQFIFLCVQPHDLYKYYEIASFGFCLRDEHILNNVACPTKLVEYMYYGIIPIIKSENIGDFKNLEYEYIKYSDLNDSMKSCKSYKNISIIKDMINNNDEEIIRNIIK